MGLFKKSKKYLYCITAHLHHYETDEKDTDYSINLEPGESYKIASIGGDLFIYNKEGDVRKRYNWQAGHTIEYSFVYKPLEWYDDSNGEE